MNSRPRFTDQVAIVTGAGTGLGPVLTGMLVNEGASVVVVGRRPEPLDALVVEHGDGVLAVAADVTVEADVERVVDGALERFGQVDVLMNGAAIPGTDAYLWEQTLDNWNSTLAVDVTAAMLCSREVVRRSMKPRGTGSIVSFSSVAAWNGMPRKSHYSTAKAALRTLTKVMAQELGPYGIRANCVVPGLIATDLFTRWVERIAAEDGVSVEQKRQELTEPLALRTVSEPVDIANAALFLASAEARTITGQSLIVDAGGAMAG